MGRVIESDQICIGEHRSSIHSNRRHFPSGAGEYCEGLGDKTWWADGGGRRAGLPGGAALVGPVPQSALGSALQAGRQAWGGKGGGRGVGLGGGRAWRELGRVLPGARAPDRGRAGVLLRL